MKGIMYFAKFLNAFVNSTRKSQQRNYSEGANDETQLIEFLYWYQEFLCPVEPLYFSDEKLITVEE